MKTNHLLLAMTFASLLLFGTSLFAQQEVDPSWYDPWAAPTLMTSHPAAPSHVARSESHPKLVSGLPKPEKLRASDAPAIRASQSRPQPVRAIVSEEIDLALPSKHYTSSLLAADVPY